MSTIEERLAKALELRDKREELKGQLRQIDVQLARLFGVEQQPELPGTLTRKKKCGTCGQEGHNSATCPSKQPPEPPEPAE